MNVSIDIRGILERSRDPFFLSNDRGELLFTNPAFREIVAIDWKNTEQQQQVEREFLALPADLPVSHARRVERCWGEGKQQRWWSLLFVPIPDDKGDLLCVLGQISSSKDSPTEIPKASDSIVPERLQRLRLEQKALFGFEIFPAQSESMRRILRQLRLAMNTREPVAFMGELGTGKEALSRLVHHHSGQNPGTLTVLDCAALPPAVQREQLLGRFDVPNPQSREARGLLQAPGPGSLVVKQVTLLGTDLQQELVRAFQRPHSAVLGGDSANDTHWRLIVTSNESLFGAMSAGKLTEEFYHLIATLIIHIPPLRERKAEFEDHCFWTLSKIAERAGGNAPSIEPRAMELLRDYDWPGNLHELHTVLEQAAGRCTNYSITARELPRRLRKRGVVAEPAKTAPNLPALDVVLEEVERRLLTLALERTRGNKAQAAEDLRISRARLLRRLENLSIGGVQESSAEVTEPTKGRGEEEE